MATLTGEQIAATYALLLKLQSTGLDATLRAVEDGDATASVLKLSTAEVEVAGDLHIGDSNKELRFYEGANYVGFEAPALSADQIWVLPDADGAADEFLQTDGAGNLSFAAGGGVGSACGFLARNTVTDSDVTGDGTVATVNFDGEIYDLGGDFAADTFTAPATGTYFLVGCVICSGILSAHTKGNVRLVTSDLTCYGDYCNPYAMMMTGSYTTLSVSATVDMDLNDTAIVQIYVDAGTKVVDVFGNAAGAYTYFGGVRLS